MKDFRKTWRKTNTACRIGTTSYIIPDDILPNLNYLSDIVEDVELVLFESDAFSNLPQPGDVAEMGRILEDAQMTVTVHLPLDAYPGAASEAERKRSAEKWLRVMDRMEPLLPFGWVVHLNDPPAGSPSDNPGKWDHWRAQCAKTIDALAARTDTRRLCVETLSYDFSHVYPLVREKGCSVCMDIGPLLLTGRDVGADLAAWLGRTRIIHLHGVNDSGRDHVDIGHMDAGVLHRILSALRADPDTPRVLTLEIFSQQDLKTSLNVLENAL